MSTEPVAASVHVDTAGHRSAPTIVLVHGAMDRGAGMLRLSRRLADAFHVVRYDRRGYGRSLDVGAPFDLGTHAADLAAVVRTHAADGRAHLVGHSLGGNVALMVADRCPDVVRSVASYEPPLSWFDWWPGSTAGAAALTAHDPADAAEAFMRRLVGDAVWERLPERTRAARRAEGVAMVTELADLRRAAPWDAARIDVPVLSIAGEHARPHHRRGAPLVAELIAGARFVELAGAGHTAPNTHATELAALLRSFVSSLDG